MKAIKILAIVISLPLFFSCEKENLSKDYYRIEIVSETPGDLVANTPSYEKIPIKKGRTTLLFDRVGNEETLFVLYLQDRCEKGKVMMTLYAGGKTSSISNESDSYTIAIEGVY